MRNPAIAAANAADNQSDDKAYDERNPVTQPNRRAAADISTDRVESRVSERQVAEIADNQVEREREYDIIADLYGQRLEKLRGIIPVTIRSVMTAQTATMSAPAVMRRLPSEFFICLS